MTTNNNNQPGSMLENHEGRFIVREHAFAIAPETQPAAERFVKEIPAKEAVPEITAPDPEIDNIN